MCGIIGYAGVEPAAPILLEGLERLEYRGYDSAGVALSGKNILRIRAAGRLDNLHKVITEHSEATWGLESDREGSFLPGRLSGLHRRCGIGHTRWATHGPPTEQNAHPHQSASSLYTIAHNGIIENHEALRSELQAHGVAFQTQTDTEVIAQLLERHDTGDPIETLLAVLPLLRGSYALAILYAPWPDKIVCAKLRSPLLACMGPTGALLASDAAALLPHSRSMVRMEDGELAVLSPKEIAFYDASGAQITKTPVEISRHVAAADKSGYEHFMRKEMAEQPEALRLTLGPLLRCGEIHLGAGEAALRESNSIDRVLFLGCGSAWHAGLAGCLVMEELTGLPCAAELASEFRSARVTVNQSTLVIVVSQSGETADTLMALRLARQAGARALGIINVEGSSIALESDSVLFTKAGLEVAVATTKAYSAQLAVIYAVAARLAQLRGSIGGDSLRAFLHALSQLPAQAEAVLLSSEKEALAWAEEIFSKEHAYFLGRNIDYAAALEGSLKLKEISYIHAEGFAAGELKHGTISLIEPGTPVIAVCARPEVIPKTRGNIEEVHARGARVYCVTNDPSITTDRRMLIPATHPLLGTSLAVLPLQLFAYHCARLRACDIDKPRSLAKSVTVE